MFLQLASLALWIDNFGVSHFCDNSLLHKRLDHRCLLLFCSMYIITIQIAILIAHSVLFQFSVINTKVCLLHFLPVDFVS